MLTENYYKNILL